MTFVMAWSSVASAMMKPEHIAMQWNIGSTAVQGTTASENLHTSDRYPVMMENTRMGMSDCHDAAQFAQVQDHQTTNTHASDTSLSNSHCDDAQQQALQGDCHECALWHCQNVIPALDGMANIFIKHPLEIDNPALIDRYQAQHLHGFWQEILRPPKA